MIRLKCGTCPQILFLERLISQILEKESQNPYGMVSEMPTFESQRDKSSVWVWSHAGKFGPISMLSNWATDKSKGGTQSCFTSKTKDHVAESTDSKYK